MTAARRNGPQIGSSVEMLRAHDLEKASFETGVVVDRLTDPAWGVVLEVEFADATRIQRIWPSPTIRLPDGR